MGEVVAKGLCCRAQPPRGYREGYNFFVVHPPATTASSRRMLSDLVPSTCRSLHCKPWSSFSIFIS